MGDHMVKGQHLSPYQKGIVKRFYEHRETLAQQKLGDLVGDLFLCESEGKKDRLWKRVDKALRTAGGNKAWVDKIVQDKDLEELALIVGQLF